MMFDPTFWIALIEIVWINILLSGDNAVVIALACRTLPPKQQKWGIILGTGPAVILRIVFAAAMAYLMAIPYLKLVGGLLLFWIAVAMLRNDEEAAESERRPARGGIWTAVRTIVVADAVMSLDNVIAIAAAARGDIILLVIGLVLSMPLIIFGSTLLLRLLHRFPILVTAGGGLLGYIAGDVIVTDPALAGWIDRTAPFLREAVPIAGAAGAILAGYVLSRLAAARRRREIKLVS